MIVIDPERWRALWRVLRTPSCWFRNYPTNEEWDRILLDLLVDHRFTDFDGFQARLGPVQVWVMNHPYASFSPHRPEVKVLPSRRTALMAHDQLLRDTCMGVEGDAAMDEIRRLLDSP